ncbi:MAG: lectin-like protein [Planctomycetota bacterium]
MLRPAISVTAALCLSGLSAAQGADDCANAQPISGLGPFDFDNVAAMATPGLADCQGVGVRKDVWYLWTAQTTARMSIQTCGTIPIETRAAVYDGTNCSALVQLDCGSSACPAEPGLLFEAIAGQSYLIRLGARSIGDSGIGTWTMSQSIPTLNPNNDVYYEVVSENLSWPLARDRAAALTWLGRQGRLAVFANQGEVDWVIANVAPQRPWIGLFQDTMSPNYSEPGGGWVWLDGTDLSFANWAAGEPNDTAAGGGPEDFAEMFGNGQWNDAEENHTNTFEFLVEYRDGGIGTNYCVANPNSTGSIGVTSATGSTTVSTNSFNLVADGLPNSTFGFFITSQTQGFVANPGGSQGNICVGGAVGRFQMQVQNTGATGSITIPADLTAFPNPSMGTVAVMPGDTWNFQAWHRDSVGGGATSNFTNGLEVVFQ